jgi:hypothetical protein
VLCADAPEAFETLIETLVSLSTPGRTEVLLCFPQRFSEPIFFEQATAYFDELGLEEAEPGIFVSRLALRTA